MHQCKTDVIASEREYIGDLYDHADQLLDNLDDIRDVFDQYLAVKLYNWRYKWFRDHYESEDWPTKNNWGGWSFEDVTFDSIPYNVCMNWDTVLNNYFEENIKSVYLPSNKKYSDICRVKLEREGLVPFYFRCNIPFPDNFINMINQNVNLNEDGDQILKNNLTPLQFEDFKKDQQEYGIFYQTTQ